MIAKKLDLTRLLQILFTICDLGGIIVISYKKLNLIEKRKGWIVDFKQS